MGPASRSSTGADGRDYCRLPIVRETLPNGVSYETTDLGRSTGDDFGPVRVPADLLAGWQDAEVLVPTSPEAARSVLADGVLPGWESVVLRLRG